MRAWWAAVARLVRTVDGPAEAWAEDHAPEVECLAAQLIWWDPQPLRRPAV